MFVSVELKWFLKQTQDLHDHFLHWGKQGQGEGSRVDAQVRNVNTTE